MSSRLFQAVREKHGLAYSIHSSVHLFGDSGMLGVYAGLDKDKYNKALDLVVREINRLRVKPVGRNELNRARDYIIGQMRLGLESTTNQMMWIADNIMSHGRFIDPDEAIESIRSVTSDDVQSLSRAILRKGRMSLALVTPDVQSGDKTRLGGQIKIQ